MGYEDRRWREHYPMYRPKCNDCKHYIVGTATCKAFPDRIPENILDGDHDHIKPYPGDNGIRFEAKDEL